MRIKISAPDISEESGTAYYRAAVSTDALSSDIEISISAEFLDFLTPACDPLLVAALAPAMYVGADIEIAGPISPELLSATRRSVQALMICNKPHLRNIRIIHEGNAYLQTKGGDCIATGFSGGIDSMCTVHDYLAEASGSHERITHLISNSFSRYRYLGDHERRLTRRAADDLGCPLIEVNSNLDSLSSPPWVDREFRALEIHTLWNSSIALALQGRVSKFYYSSAYSYPSLHFGAADEVAFIDSELLRLLSTSSIQLCSVGSEYSRVEKTRRSRRLAQSRRFLNVCVNPDRSQYDKNCGRCEKCMRTLLTLDLTGGAEEFGEAFDLPAWRLRRSEYIAGLWFRNDPFSQELRELMREVGEGIPKKHFLAVGARRAKGLTVNTAKKIAQAVLPAPLIRALKSNARR